ncbi:MAG TPA: ATP-binding protein [Nitrospiraceae bacterium]|nr:ATP-binding protein [Nitrospiraceae bacterium]
MTSKIKRFNGVLAWVMVSGIVLVALTIAAVNLLDRLVIEQAAAQNLHAEFLRAAGSVSRIIGKSGNIHDLDALREAFQDIFELRPGIHRLSVYEITPVSTRLILSSDPEAVPDTLSLHEQTELTAGRSVAHFDDSLVDRAWLITAPIRLNGQIVGALRGRYSVWKYDHLIRQEGRLAKDVGIAAVTITCLVFLLLIRMKVHQPIRQLLQAMRRAEGGDLTSQAPLVGPSDLQDVAGQFNRMLGRVREALAVKEALLGEIQGFNDMLKRRVAETKEELHRANSMLVEARIQTERAEKLAALGELSAVMAHELGNPLNAISGHLQLLSKQADRQERYRHLTIIRSEIDRMVTIIQHILESTRLQVRSAAVDLNEVIRGVEGLIAPSLSGKRIVFKMDLAAPLPSVGGDQRALHGMIFNLVTNAIQAMPDGGELTVKTLYAIDERIQGTIVLRGDAALKRGAVRLILQDTGCGIPSDHVAKIFEPFFTTRHNRGGTGLGLAICHRVVSSVGGRMAVHSVVGQGTCFTIDLPVWDDSRTGDQHHES